MEHQWRNSFLTQTDGRCDSQTQQDSDVSVSGLDSLSRIIWTNKAGNEIPELSHDWLEFTTQTQTFEDFFFSFFQEVGGFALCQETAVDNLHVFIIL